MLKYAKFSLVLSALMFGFFESSVWGQPNPLQSSTGVESGVVYLSSEEAKFLELINRFRKKLGLNELRIHVGLQEAASKHSAWMAAQDLATKRDTLDHFGPTPSTSFSDRITKEGYASYTTLGENLACGSKSALETFRQFAFSPSHLKNMLSPRYRHIGIARGGTGNEACPYYWTNDFGSKDDPSTDLGAVTDTTKITQVIEEISKESSVSSQMTAQTAQEPTSPNATRKESIKCIIPYTQGRGLLTDAIDTQTTIDVTSEDNGYSMSVSFEQTGTNARFDSYLIPNVSVVKNRFHPLTTLFVSPNDKFGGFIIQIDTSIPRAQFDPYPGSGGLSGMVRCMIR